MVQMASMVSKMSSKIPVAVGFDALSAEEGNPPREGPLPAIASGHRQVRQRPARQEGCHRAHGCSQATGMLPCIVNLYRKVPIMTDWLAQAK